MNNNDESDALMLACKSGHLEGALFLIEQGADVNYYDKNHDTPLLRASQEGYVEIVSLLLRQGANVNFQSDDGFSALYLASCHGHIEVVIELLRHGADVNFQNKQSRTPLLMACEEGHYEIVSLLVVHGAQVNMLTSFGGGTAGTPLNEACEKGHADIAFLLIENGADVNLMNRSGKAPLQMVSDTSDLDHDRVQIISKLIEKGADLSRISAFRATIICTHFGRDFTNLHQVKRWIFQRDWLIYLSSADSFSPTKGTSLSKLVNIPEMNGSICHFL